MIIELEDDEIKQACLEYILNHYDVCSENNDIEDVKLLCKAQVEVIRARIVAEKR